ncbi:MAG: endonuclease [Tannerella sp.]|nr:endonuclease [Tannerella sp.]
MKRISNIIIVSTFVLLLGCGGCGGNHTVSKIAGTSHAPALQSNSRKQNFCVMFYNVENLFDIYDDPDKNDDEFLPNGANRWTAQRYYNHLRNTAQVITAAGEWDTPALCGLCEVENDTVLTHLISRTPLRAQNYNYCITTGSDRRGINNALMYQRDKFRYLSHASRRIPFGNKAKLSRDILHVEGEIITGERLHVFVCHFPSRSGGEKESEPDRIDAATFLRHICDSLLNADPAANIVAMGDFNDSPNDKSIKILTQDDLLVNLFGNPNKLNYYGSHKFQGEWSQIDQMFVSRHFYSYLKKDGQRIFAAEFLLTPKNSRGEQSPARNYQGPIYKNGYSDHLPILADFEM